MDQKLRDDFPIDTEEELYVSRREFFKFMTLASGGLAVGSIGLAAWAQTSREERAFERRRIASVGDLAPGGAVHFAYPRPVDPCILVRGSDGELRAFSTRCTHLSCPVEYQPGKGRFYCPCHNGAFSIEDGSVLQGPPPHALPRIQLEIVGDEVFAVGVTHGGHA